jgi:nucleoside-diphosphate-sugar epimerase
LDVNARNKQMTVKDVVLIAGVHGVSGRAAAEHWISIPGTRVYGLARRSAPLPSGVEAISADLLDRDENITASATALVKVSDLSSPEG